MTTTPDTRLTPPVALAVVLGLGDIALAAIGWTAYTTYRTASWAALYVFGIEAAAGVLILLLAVIGAGRSAGVTGSALGLAWLRLFGVIMLAILIPLSIGFPRPFDGQLAIPLLLAVVDAVAGVVICGSIARRTRLRL